MENINKYFMILENLKFFTKTKDDNKKRIEENFNTLKKYLKLNSKELNDLSTLKELGCPIINDDNNYNIWSYVCYLIHVMQTIKSQANFDSNAKEDLISVQHMNLFLEAVIEVSRYGIRCFLPDSVKNHPIFKLNVEMYPPSSTSTPKEIKSTIKFLFNILQIKTFLPGSMLEPVILELMAAIYTTELIVEEETTYFQNSLSFLWNQRSKEKYFKNLLILKSITELPTSIQMKIHSDLLDKLTQPGGFQILAENLSISGKNDPNIPHWRRYKVISNIVARKGYPPQFYKNMINQIFEFLRTSVFDQNLSLISPAGVIALRNLYLLNEKLKGEILHKFDEMIKPLYEPEDLLTGAIVMEDLVFKLLINFFFICFCGSSFEVIPSEILTKYLPLLTQIYNRIPDKCNESDPVKSLIIQCLANRERSEMKAIISHLLLNNKNNMAYKVLHPRILIIFNEKFNTYSIQIRPVEEMQHDTFAYNNLSKILKTSNNNIFIYNAFMCILELLDDEAELGEATDVIAENHNIDFIQDQIEFDHFIEHNYRKKLNVICCLTDLIGFKSFHSQFSDNPDEILNFIKKFLKKRLDKNDEYNDENDHILSVILAICQEILEANTKNFKEDNEFLRILKEFLKRIKNFAIKCQVENLISLIEGGGASSRSCLHHQSQYSFFRSLIEESQTHLRVYGMTQLIKLLKDKDEETRANRNAILVIALHTLRDQESYTYLNCVRLLVSLVDVLEAEVLEALSTEYLNEDENLEYRLKVGEAILKVSEDLGPLVYKYKDVLINCFLHGCKNNKIKEFCTSSFSNLATVCRLLSYQIHNFFQELIVLIGDILQSETYLPIKRSAVMTLSELLSGMDNISNFQDYLLPIYRILKSIVENDKDEVTRVHATNGLKTLNEKCKEFLFPEQKLQKEIKIFGINDKTGSRKDHILELN